TALARDPALPPGSDFQTAIQGAHHLEKRGVGFVRQYRTMKKWFKKGKKPGARHLYRGQIRETSVQIFIDRWLIKGYDDSQREKGLLVSQDRLRQVRWGNHEKNGKAPLHLHFERLDQNGKIVASYIYEVIR
ncbi:MAG: hypothetical protein N0E56_21420, partial [Candidatus Thiodiazotropha endolucinida]|nr:hypothetical protein [Candidatus Thiodiazotropha taylori]MCW4269174.1 hypothetical protein [Candidatus Thiodiazotropha endolucinida]